MQSKIIAAIENLLLQNGDTSADRPSALGFESCVGVEHIDLSKPLKIEGRVENYLQDVIDNVMSSLRDILVKSIESFAVTPTEKWVKKEPNQIILTTSLVYFTKKMEGAFADIKNGDDKAMEKMLQFKKDALTELIDLVRTNLTKAERMKIMCLITLDAHSRDICQNLLEGNVTIVTQFEWQSQLRFEWRAKESDCFIMIVDAEFTYCFEYIGNGARLVITPLTDRIYVTATQVCHFLVLFVFSCQFLLSRAGPQAEHGLRAPRPRGNRQNGNNERFSRHDGCLHLRFQLCARDGLPFYGRHLEGPWSFWRSFHTCYELSISNIFLTFAKFASFRQPGAALTNSIG